MHLARPDREIHGIIGDDAGKALGHALELHDRGDRRLSCVCDWLHRDARASKSGHRKAGLTIRPGLALGGYRYSSAVTALCTLSASNAGSTLIAPLMMSSRIAIT